MNKLYGETVQKRKMAYLMSIGNIVTWLYCFLEGSETTSTVLFEKRSRKGFWDCLLTLYGPLLDMQREMIIVSQQKYKGVKTS